VVAFAGPGLVTVVLLPFGPFFGLASILLFTLVAVGAAAVLGGLRPALAAVVVGLALGWYLHEISYGALRTDLEVDLAKLITFAVVGVGAGVLIDRLTRVAEEQAALRRVATLVARGAAPATLFAAVTEEVGRYLRAGIATMGQYAPDGTLVVLAYWPEPDDPSAVVAPAAPGDDNLAARVFETGLPARIDNSGETLSIAGGPVGALLDGIGVRSLLGAPIVVDDRLWGLMAVGSLTRRCLAQSSDGRLAAFTELVATAIANAEKQAQLAASRARVVTSADEARRRIERDLHDGLQQRLVSLSLGLRTAQSTVPDEMRPLGDQLSHLAGGLTNAIEELRTISRGIHPANLARRGIEPAINSVARASAVPVEVEVRADRRLPEPIEVAVYYIVSEALTNVAKHARASLVRVDVHADDTTVQLSIADDGIGGADPNQGSGLIGLRDRVESLGGTLEIASGSPLGTSILATIPVDPE
jgi:signal transduction histidine kinase